MNDSNEYGKIGKNLTEGSIFKLILTFSLPMLIGNSLQLLQQIINAFWIGRFLGTNEFSAVTLTFPIIFILISFVIGVTIAATTLVSQNKGAGNHEMVKKVIENSFAFTFLLAIISTIIFMIFSRQILLISVNPQKMPEVFNLAYGYLLVSLSGLVFIFGFNLISAILRGLGDSWTPLKILSIAVVINLILDPLLILGIGKFPSLGINGSAIATIIAQIISFIFAVRLLNIQNVIKLKDFKGFKFDWDLIKQIFKLGLPIGLQQIIVSTGIFFMTIIVSTFGINTISVFGIGSRLDSLCFMPAMAIGMAVTALTGQNLGAGRKDRVIATVRIATILTLLITIFIVLFCWIFPSQIIQFFLGSSSVPQNQLQDIINQGTAYLRIVSIGYFGISLIFVTNGVLLGAGDTLPPMIFAILSFWIFRIPLAWFFSQHTQLKSSGIWLGTCIGFIISAILSGLYYKFGSWEKKVSIHKPI